jgi:hypothetical protein
MSNSSSYLASQVVAQYKQLCGHLSVEDRIETMARILKAIGSLHANLVSETELEEEQGSSDDYA